MLVDASVTGLCLERARTDINSPHPFLHYTVREENRSRAASHQSLKIKRDEVKMDGEKLAAKSVLPAGEIIRAPAPKTTECFLCFPVWPGQQ